MDTDNNNTGTDMGAMGGEGTNPAQNPMPGMPQTEGENTAEMPAEGEQAAE